MHDSTKPAVGKPAEKLNKILTIIATLILIAGISFAFYKSSNSDPVRYQYQKQSADNQKGRLVKEGELVNDGRNAKGNSAGIGKLENLAADKNAANTTQKHPTGNNTAYQNGIAEHTISIQTVSLIAVGDIMLSRGVARKIKQHKDLNYPFLKIKEYIKSADIAFGNLEGPITAGPEVLGGQMRFRADPGVERALRDAGFSILSLANNHTSDYGAKGLTDTINYLDEVGIRHFGAGQNLDQASKPVYLTVKGIKIAFLAYNDPAVVPKSYGATESRAGTNFMDAQRMAMDVQAAKQQADLVIISMHAGTEYSVPDKKQMNFARAAIDAGADLVLGHHPHVIQGIEEYKGKYIFYSLGNFIFDQAFSKETTRGLAVKIFLTKEGVTRYELDTVIIKDASSPELIQDAKERADILKKVQVVKYLN